MVGVWVARFTDIGLGDPMATAPPDGSILRISPRWTATSQWRLQASSAGPIVVCSLR